ncbi:DUF2974 domain-containing protein [Streptococcus massiliensis]|uniref:Lipase n=1 Tax=Streptococcus massiliensis TaxID=313439 RepID=A0A380L2E3_9STRE|nr:DUF2974 domain-containing protein [Streptococcus massiliensis]SUN77417.1 lipase [Streptococcus massiliensis]
MNLFDYLEQVKNETIYDKDLTILDLLMFTELSYINFDGVADKNFDRYHAKRLDDCAEALTDLAPTPTIMGKEHLQLLQQMGQSLRFKSSKLMGYVNDIDSDIEKQFSATTFRIKPDTYIVAFRGTDDSIIGWKEDFHMTYMPQIPAQLTATHYLEKALAELPGTFYVTGHSKGGNLATFATSHLSSENQERIKLITSFDAPGLNKLIIETAGYQSISPKIERYIPYGSIVGMMLEIPETAHIVQSTAIGGIAQHNPFSWKVENDSFLLADGLNADSLQTDKTLKNWVASTPDDQLKQFFDLFFGLILDANITSITDFFQLDAPKKIITILDNTKALDPNEKEMLIRLTKLLFSLRFESWKEESKLPKFPLPFTGEKEELS